jgi:hypothetical protein
MSARPKAVTCPRTPPSVPASSDLSKPLKNIFTFFGPWTADVHHPLLMSLVMNVVMTALNDRPVKKRGVGVLACRLPHRPGACLFSPRAPLVAPTPPSEGGSLEAKACQFDRRALFLCASVVKIREFHFGSSRLCVESGQPFLPRASGISTHSKSIRALRAIRGHPSPGN